MAKQAFYRYSRTTTTTTTTTTKTALLPSKPISCEKIAIMGTRPLLLLLAMLMMILGNIGVIVEAKSATGNQRNNAQGNHNYTTTITTPTKTNDFVLPTGLLHAGEQRSKRDATSTKGTEQEVDTQEAALVSGGGLNNNNNNNRNNNLQYINSENNGMQNLNTDFFANNHNGIGLDELQQSQRQQQKQQREHQQLSLKSHAASYGNPLKEINIIKRAPNGFIGMRGKKEFGDDNNNDYVDWNLDPIEQTAYNNLMGREDNDHDNDNDNDYNSVRFKKTPTAFYGVRGKKYLNVGGAAGGGGGVVGSRGLLVNDYNVNEMLEDMEAERLREKLFRDFLGALSVKQAAENEVVIKRAPTGFTGLRGKRPSNNVNWNHMLFNGLREDADFDGSDSRDVDKRAPTTAFVGVRGKKDLSHQHYKRSSNDPFATKRQRFIDFNNKFVAVRGKKNNIFDDMHNHDNGGDDDDNDNHDVNGIVADVNYNPNANHANHIEFNHANRQFGSHHNDNAIKNSVDDDDDDIDDDDDAYADGMEEQNYNGRRLQQQLNWLPSSNDWFHNRLRYFVLPSFLYGTNGKRAPNGFVGMRGKRPTANDAEKMMQ